MMCVSIRKAVGLAGLGLLLLTIQIAGSIRGNDWTEMLDLEGWSWAIIPAVFMGAWGWITLFFSRMASTKGAAVGLLGVAIIYFVIMIMLTFDIVLNGNSTSGIAFFFLPVLATVIMLPLIAFVSWIGLRLNGDSVD